MKPFTLGEGFATPRTSNEIVVELVEPPLEIWTSLPSVAESIKVSGLLRGVCWVADKKVDSRVGVGKRRGEFPVCP